jgi:hypothetical protein
MRIVLNGEEFIFSSRSKLVDKKNCYDLELIEDGFDKKTEKFFSGGVDAKLQLPLEIEASISRTNLLPVAKIFKDKNGKMRLSAYFD